MDRRDFLSHASFGLAAARASGTTPAETTAGMIANDRAMAEAHER